ncbi:MAG: hypothetical protein HZY75_07795 [Nocardioidaceae bacterium]|nr:MAG: hypothetical protein HZY75_07795 [Nocardioidaceae bacterium]
MKAPGWKCDPPADDRFGCTNGTDIVTVTVRSAAVRDDYLHDPDKATDTYASELHGDVFATVMGVNPIAVHEVAEHLVWK